MKRIWFAAAAVVALCGLAAAPARAATAKPAVYFVDHTAMWAPNQAYGWAWSGTNQIYNAQFCTGCGGVPFSFEIINGSGGYNEFAEVQCASQCTFLQLTGYCAGWNQSLFRIVKQSCTGATWQLWAGTGTSPDLIWNQWYQQNFPHVCPISGGYTQSVVTSDSALGAVYLSCPQGAGGQSYLGTQKWYVT